MALHAKEPRWRMQGKRDLQWTEPIAVGSEGVVREVAARIKGRQRLEIEGTGDRGALKERCAPYPAITGPKTACKG